MVPVDAVAAPQSASLTCVLYTAGSGDGAGGRGGGTAVS